MIQLPRVKRCGCGRSATLRRANWCAALLVIGIAVARLASAALAQSPATSTSSSTTTVRAASGQLQGLVRATDAQFRIAFRNDAEEHERRREQLAAAVSAWRAAARSAANDQLLADWLRAVIRKSMPGSHGTFPAIPKFDQPVVARTAAAATPMTGPTSTMHQKPVVENSEPAQAKTPSMKMDSRNGNAAATAADAEQDFWTAHPANAELPAELSGDPFQDDP